MRVVYECEKVVIFEDKELFVIHVLDNYRFVKEIKTDRANLLSVLEKEFHDTTFIRGFCFGKKILKSIHETLDVERVFKFI